MLLKDLFKEMLDNKAASMHMSAGLPPMFNINGRLMPTPAKRLEPDEISQMAYALMNPIQERRFILDSSINFTYELETLGRFRVTFFKQKGMINALFRPLASRIPDIKELNLPDQIIRLCQLKTGLVILGGSAGSGKSTTLAAILNELNKHRKAHIITLEDPIEFSHQPQNSLFSQREIGIDTKNFPKALREAVRQDADIIMIGEMRDIETIKIALTAAETGILVFGTMSTTDCVQTVTRLISVFPTDFQQQVRTQLAISLKAVVCQQLVMRQDNKGRIPACEIMFSNQAIQSLIREKKFHQIYTAIESGSENGMQTLDQALQKLYKVNIISDLEVVTKSVKPEQLKKKLFDANVKIPGKEDLKGFIDLGEEMIKIEKKALKYQANFTPGQEGYWTSSVAVTFEDDGLVLNMSPGMSLNRLYVSDFNIVSKKVAPFAIPHKLLVRFKLDSGEDSPESDPELNLKLFAQPEPGKPTSYNKISLNYPLKLDNRWHTWVINIPDEVVGKMLKIVMLEFPVVLTRVAISDIIFF